MQGNGVWGAGGRAGRSLRAPLTPGSHELLQGKVRKSFLHLNSLGFLLFKIFTTPHCHILVWCVLDPFTTDERDLQPGDKLGAPGAQAERGCHRPRS